MTQKLSLNTQAILLLTAPLLFSKNNSKQDLLTNNDYKNLARHLRDMGKQPSDLLSNNENELLNDCKVVIDKSRIERLLARGFLLAQNFKYWSERSIWVVSRADENYPSRLKSRLKENAPPVIYGCGDIKITENGGFAVVGSRLINSDLMEYTKEIGRLAARSHKTIISGGAKGVDISAIQGSLEEGGKACGFLSDSLEKAAMDRGNRDSLMNNQLVLITANDPRAYFTVGFAMQRNKYIYALSDIALVINSDLKKGGTWAGAQEQLDKLRMVTVYVRSTGEKSLGIEGLVEKGAKLWPNPKTPEDFILVINKDSEINDPSKLIVTEAQQELDVRKPEDAFLNNPAVSSSFAEETLEDLTTPINVCAGKDNVVSTSSLLSDGGGSLNLELHVQSNASEETILNPSEKLFSNISNLICELLITPMKERQIADELQVLLPQVKAWLIRLVSEGKIEKIKKGGNYIIMPKTLPFTKDIARS